MHPAMRAPDIRKRAQLAACLQPARQLDSRQTASYARALSMPASHAGRDIDVLWSGQRSDKRWLRVARGGGGSMRCFGGNVDALPPLENFCANRPIYSCTLPSLCYIFLCRPRHLGLCVSPLLGAQATKSPLHRGCSGFFLAHMLLSATLLLCVRRVATRTLLSSGLSG